MCSYECIVPFENEIESTSEVWVDAALHAHFCGAAVRGLGRSASHFRVGQEVRRPSQLLCNAPLAERAESACIRTPVCVVYVPAPSPQNVGASCHDLPLERCNILFAP